MGPELIIFQYQFLRTVIEKPFTGTVHCPVDLRGFEPLTSSVRLKRAPNCATGPNSKCKVFYLRQKGMSSTGISYSTKGTFLQIPYILLSSDVHAHLLKLSYSPPYKKFGDGGRAIAEFQFKRAKGLLLPNNPCGSAKPTPIHKFSTQFCNPIFTAIF
jgi:hypothetical protein